MMKKNSAGANCGSESWARRPSNEWAPGAGEGKEWKTRLGVAVSVVAHVDVAGQGMPASEAAEVASFGAAAIQAAVAAAVSVGLAVWEVVDLAVVVEEVAAAQAVWCLTLFPQL